MGVGASARPWAVGRAWAVSPRCVGVRRRGRGRKCKAMGCRAGVGSVPQMRGSASSWAWAQVQGHGL